MPPAKRRWRWIARTAGLLLLLLLADYTLYPLLARPGGISVNRGENGLWQHPSYPELARWLTFDVLVNLRRLEAGEWVGLAPRTSFRAYPKRRRRY